MDHVIRLTLQMRRSEMKHSESALPIIVEMMIPF